MSLRHRNQSRTSVPEIVALRATETWWVSCFSRHGNMSVRSRKSGHTRILILVLASLVRGSGFFLASPKNPA